MHRARRPPCSLRFRARAACALAACLIAACTSEARIGYWTTSPLAAPDAATMVPSPPLAGHDAAVADPPIHIPPDGGFVHASPLCLRNPSLDGIPIPSKLEPGSWWPAEAWDLCWNDPEDFPDPSMAPLQISAVAIVNDATVVELNDGTTAMAGLLPPPTHGVGYLHFDTLRDLPERTSQEMCAELEAGVTYNFAIDLASRVGQSYEGSVLSSGVLEIYGAAEVCGHTGEPLWRSPPLTSDWKRYCVSITPTITFSFMTLQMPAKDRPRSAILVDNIRLDDSCGSGFVP